MAQYQHPLSGSMSDVLAGLAGRLGVRPFEGDLPARAALGAFALVNGALSVGVLAPLAFVTDQPFLFPSLGPTAFLLFYRPLEPANAPRSIVLGHLIGLLSGFVALALFGQVGAPSAFTGGFSLREIGAATVSLGLTAGFMTWLDAPHPAAAATTLIVSLSLMTAPLHLTVMMLAVVLLAAQGVIMNSLAGLDVPLWTPRRAIEADDSHPSDRDAGGDEGQGSG